MSYKGLKKNGGNRNNVRSIRKKIFLKVILEKQYSKINYILNQPKAKSGVLQYFNW